MTRKLLQSFLQYNSSENMSKKINYSSDLYILMYIHTQK